MDPLTIKIMVTMFALTVWVCMYAVWDGGRLLREVQKDLEKYPDDGPPYWVRDGVVYVRTRRTV